MGAEVLRRISHQAIRKLTLAEEEKRKLTDTIEAVCDALQRDSLRVLVAPYSEISTDLNKVTASLVEKLIHSTLNLISQHKEVEERLRESERRFRSVAESAADAIVLADAHGKIVFWNRNAGEMFGHTEDDVR